MRMVIGIHAGKRARQASSHSEAPTPTVWFASWRQLAGAFNDLRNQAGPASHGKDPYLEQLAIHHRRSAVLAADAIVAFMHKAYLDSQLDPTSSRELWEGFSDQNALIDVHVGLAVETDDEGCLA